jgi:hypothetical protein
MPDIIRWRFGRTDGMGFFEKTGGDGFFQKVGMMFGNEFNIRSQF